MFSPAGNLKYVSGEARCCLLATLEPRRSACCDLADAKEIVLSYDIGVTLRQLFYRLVAYAILPNLQSYYRRLSSTTAEARRTAGFPDLLDRTSRIERALSFDGSADGMDFLIRNLYRRDRTEGQQWSLYLGVEKAGLSEQLDAWFGDELGVPILALGGYASQSLVDKVRRDIDDSARPAVLIYAGDMDPTGEDIDRDFVHRVGDFDKVIRVALQEEQNRWTAVQPRPARDQEAGERSTRCPVHAATRHPARRGSRPVRG